MHRPSSYACFLQALNVMNAALELYRDSLTLRPVLAQAESELEGVDLVVAIFDDEQPSRPVDRVTIRLQQGVFVVVSHGSTSCDIDWHVARSELAQVAKDPRSYLDDPERLNLEWLKNRVGVKASPPGARDRQLSTTSGNAPA
jgi:hypothetical protein